MLSLVGWAWQDTRRQDGTPAGPKPCSVGTSASQPVASLLPSLLPPTRRGKHWISGSNPVSGSGTASQEQSGPPVASAEIRSCWQRLAEPAYLSLGDEDKKPKTQEDPVSLNNAVATQDKGPPSLRSCHERTPSAPKDMPPSPGQQHPTPSTQQTRDKRAPSDHVPV